jgi:two-component sensor histidine kinase
MREYVCDLTRHLQDSFSSDARIDISIDVAPLSLDVSQAVPLGLILNEAITNIIKYAFKNTSEKGNVHISLKESESGFLSLMVRDNGTGLPHDFNPEKSKSLGMQLITGLSRQLRGTCTFINNGGLRLTVNVPLAPKLTRE